MKTRLGPIERLYPMPCVLVVGGTLERADTLAVAWLNVIASTPPSVAMGLRDSRHTLALIRETGTFTVNTPSASMVAQVDFCGITNGAQVDKFAAAGLTLEPSDLVEAPLIAECPYNLECRVTSEVTVGSYTVLIGEIVEAHADPGILGDDGIVDVARLDPLCYIPGAREYRRVGEKVADAYSIGKTI